jgi:glycosidase
MIEIRKEYIENNTSYEVQWDNTNEQVLSFARVGSKGRLFVSLNISEISQKWNKEAGKMILASSGDKELLESMGYKIYFKGK